MLSNMQSSIRAHTKAHTLVVEHIQDSMQINTKKYILVIGQHHTQDNTQNNILEQEHTLANLLKTLVRGILVQTIKSNLQKHTRVIENIMVSILKDT